MKKQFVFSSTRNALVRLSLAALLVISTATAFAAGGDEPFVNIKYIGAVENRAQVQVDLVNENDETYILTINDEEGNVLYKEKINSKTFAKKFELNNADINNKMTFNVTGIKSKKTQVFQINSQVRTIQDVVITKL